MPALLIIAGITAVLVAARCLGGRRTPSQSAQVEVLASTTAGRIDRIVSA